jgi:tetratricopeptide (TPR) repeat protein
MLQARDILTAQAAKTPQDPLPQLELALFFFQTGDMGEAERVLLDMQKRFPTFARAQYRLGLLYLKLGRIADASTPLQKAAELSPTDTFMQTTAGHVLLRLGREPEAQKYADRALKLDPKQPDTYLLLARLNDHHGTALKAIEYGKKYLEYSANPAPGLYLIGRTYARLADSKNAETYLIQARDIDPKNPEIWRTLGRIYFELQRQTKTPEGIQCFSKVLEIDPKDWEAHLWLGRARMDEMKFEDAIAHFREAIINSPKPGPLYYDLSQALLKGGQNDEGQKMLAIYNSYQTYNKEAERLTALAAKSPNDRNLRYAIVAHCLQYKQYRAALGVLKEAERTLGADATSKKFHDQIALGLSASGNPANPPAGGLLR